MRLVSTVARQRSSGSSSSGTGGALMPALLKRKSSRPKRARTAANSACTASKHGVSGITRAASLDGRAFDIAVGQIDIGNAATDMTERMTGGVPQADGSVRPEPRMDVQHVAEAIVHMANLPLASNVMFMTIMATKMPFVGRG